MNKLTNNYIINIIISGIICLYPLWIINFSNSVIIDSIVGIVLTLIVINTVWIGNIITLISYIFALYYSYAVYDSIFIRILTTVMLIVYIAIKVIPIIKSRKDSN
jgi:hypothetical protein